MEEIENYILNDILKSIENIGFSTEKVPFLYLHAATNSKCDLIVYNPDTVTLYELAEEYIHALKRHHRRNLQYDFNNPNEAEAHNLALDYLIERWRYYECQNNWSVFMDAIEAPKYLQNTIEQVFSVQTTRRSGSF